MSTALVLVFAAGHLILPALVVLDFLESDRRQHQHDLATERHLAALATLQAASDWWFAEERKRMTA